MTWSRDDDEYDRELTWRERERAEREQMSRIAPSRDDRSGGEVMTPEERARVVVSIWLHADVDDFTQSCIADRADSLVRRIALELSAVEAEVRRGCEQAAILDNLKVCAAAMRARSEPAAGATAEERPEP